MELEQERFEAWLFSQPGDRVIEAGHTHKCFYCSFLKETTNIKRPYFLTSSYSTEKSLTVTRVPTWAIRLINEFAMYELCPSNSLWPITCAQMQARYRQLFPETDPVIPQQKPKPQEQHAHC